jgi:hypothetical protein
LNYFSTESLFKNLQKRPTAFSIYLPGLQMTTVVEKPAVEHHVSHAGLPERKQHAAPGTKAL